MRRALIAPENPLWRNVLGVLAATVLIPTAVVLKLVTTLFARPTRRTAEEVALYLRGFLEGTDGEWDWDDFTSIPVADPDLESIRKRAATVALPLSDEGRTALVALLAEAEEKS